MNLTYLQAFRDSNLSIYPKILAILTLLIIMNKLLFLMLVLTISLAEDAPVARFAFP
jgi:hypothetical protein